MNKQLKKYLDKMISITETKFDFRNLLNLFKNPQVQFFSIHFYRTFSFMKTKSLFHNVKSIWRREFQSPMIKCTLSIICVKVDGGPTSNMFL